MECLDQTKLGLLEIILEKDPRRVFLFHTLPKVLEIQKYYLKLAETRCPTEKIERVKRECAEFYIQVVKQKNAMRIDTLLGTTELTRLAAERMEKRRKQKGIRTFSELQLCRVVA